MIFNFNGIEIENYKIEVKLGNKIIQTAMLPSFMAQPQFYGIVQEISQDERPMQVRCSINDYTESNKEIENCLIFSNNAYINAFSES